MISPEKFSNKSIPSSVEILLIRTGYEKYRGSEKYWNDNPGFSQKVADYLRSRFPSLRCIGFDFISLTSWKHRDIGKIVHGEFLSPGKNIRPVLIIEDMALVNIQDKLNRITVAPLMVEGSDGGPVTVFGEYRKRDI